MAPWYIFIHSFIDAPMYMMHVCHLAFMRYISLIQGLIYKNLCKNIISKCVGLVVSLLTFILKVQVSNLYLPSLYVKKYMYIYLSGRRMSVRFWLANPKTIPIVHYQTNMWIGSTSIGWARIQHSPWFHGGHPICILRFPSLLQHFICEPLTRGASPHPTYCTRGIAPPSPPLQDVALKSTSLTWYSIVICLIDTPTGG